MGAVDTASAIDARVVPNCPTYLNIVTSNANEDQPHQGGPRGYTVPLLLLGSSAVWW